VTLQIARVVERLVADFALEIVVVEMTMGVPPVCPAQATTAKPIDLDLLIGIQRAAATRIL